MQNKDSIKQNFLLYQNKVKFFIIIATSLKCVFHPFSKIGRPLSACSPNMFRTRSNILTSHSVKFEQIFIIFSYVHEIKKFEKVSTSHCRQIVPQMVWIQKSSYVRISYKNTTTFAAVSKRDITTSIWNLYPALKMISIKYSQKSFEIGQVVYV